jgi:hypothetical protein
MITEMHEMSHDAQLLTNEVIRTSTLLGHRSVVDGGGAAYTMVGQALLRCRVVGMVGRCGA